MTFEEFQKKSSFGRDEVLAFSRGQLIENPPTGLPSLPAALLLPFHEITRIDWDEASQTGRLEAQRHNRLDDWFYGCHFIGDPVMPGCWGVDAVWQCLKFFAAWRGLAGCDKTLGMENVSFFGQIRPYDAKISYVVEVTSIETQEGQAMITGKAAVAVDGVPVYSIGSAQVATDFWEDDTASAAQSAPAPAQPGAAFTRRLGYNEFAARGSFSQAEVIAISLGTLIENPPVEVGLLPSSLMLEVGQVERIAYDSATGEGSIHASKQNNPLDWFYPMSQGFKPAALSIDAVWQLLGLFLAWRQNAGTGRALGFERVEVFDAVRPSDARLAYEIKISRLSRSESSGDAFVRADAQVFADGRRILACANANVGCHNNIRYSDYPLRNDMAFGGKLKSKQAR